MTSNDDKPSPVNRQTYPGPHRYPRFLFRSCRVVLLGVLGASAILFLGQHALIYHPHAYQASYERLLPAGAVELHFNSSAGSQTAFYLPVNVSLGPSERIWVVFCGNGSLALDWVPLVTLDHDPRDAYLLIDYPGYGKSEGRATIASTEAAADGALKALASHFRVDEAELEPRLNVIGHSLGAAAALEFALHHPIKRIILFAPFTTLREEAATVIGRPLSYLLRENYDNRAALRLLALRRPQPRVLLFHGSQDRLIPIRMGSELAAEFPAIVTFYPIAGANHDSIVLAARKAAIAWMSRN